MIDVLSRISESTITIGMPIILALLNQIQLVCTIGIHAGLRIRARRSQTEAGIGAVVSRPQLASSGEHIIKAVAQT